MIEFYKYQGTGNDFVMIDNRLEKIARTDLDFVRKWCDRKFGIGADGLILIENHPDHDFEMIYFNSDGSMSFCGNGSRCAVRFASFLGIIEKNAQFLAIDGVHQAHIDENNWVHLKMGNVSAIESIGDDLYLDTGSPHYIRFVPSVMELNILSEAQEIRYNDRFSKVGTNVNFVEIRQESLLIRTYERGVEGETLSCGTGATAVALGYADSTHMQNGNHRIALETMGGDLAIAFHKTGNQFNDIRLIGPAEQVFKGEITR